MVWPLNKHQEMASAKQAVLSGRGRRSTYKVGGWYHTGNFPDNRTDEQGRFLGSALSTGKPQIRSGNWGLYIIADQMLWREKPDADEGLGLFGRLTYSPPDRSFYDFYADFGVTCTGLIAGRDDDSFGVAFAYGHISQDRRDVQRATGVWAQDHTAVLEVSYQVAVTPWWLIQPDFQYFLDPDGSSSRGSLPDAVVVGLRTQISF
jgi:porin